MRRFLALFLLLAGSVLGQVPPYNLFPPADPPYFRVRYPASTDPGSLTFAVNYTMWIPPGTKSLRGILVHQHGCGEGSCKSGLTGAYDLHWQALAKKHQCALLAPAYEQPEAADCQLWCDPRNGSDAAFQRALVDLGTQSGHPELSRVPWALWGHSGGGFWAGGMALLHPDRVVAAWLRSGVPPIQPVEGRPAPYSISEAACQVPLMCNLGVREGVLDRTNRFAGVWPGVERYFKTLRSRGALIGVSIDPLTSHECGNQRYLAIPWLDACLTARLPSRAGGALKPMPSRSAYLVPINAKGTDIVSPVAAAQYSGDPRDAAWIPNREIAAAWEAYSRNTAVPDLTPPPAPRNLRVVGNELTWEADADVESGLAQFMIERDGHFLANVPEHPKNPFGRPVFQNLQYSDTPPQPIAALRYVDTTADPTRRHHYRVIAVNTTGLKSH